MVDDTLTSSSALPRIFKASPRGIGLDKCGGCFVCAQKRGDHMYEHNISCFVPSRETGEAIVALFNQGARLDYRHFEPKWIQVKIGSCDEHKPNLEALLAMIEATREREDGPGINGWMVAESLKVAVPA